MKALRSYPSFSHLFFANNLVLFAKTNLDNCMVIKEVLDNFCRVSGQTISGAKSKSILFHEY